MFRSMRPLTGIAMVLALAAAALAWVPKAEIKAERISPTKFRLTGKNAIGNLDVLVEDKHLFQGFKGTGKNGDNVVDFDIKSAGLGQGWIIEGKNGSTVIDLKSKQQGVLSKEWKVTGKVGDKAVDVTIDGDWNVDPAIVSSLVAFDNL